MAQNEELYAFTLQGFWMDIGQPKDFLKGMKLYLAHVSKHPELSLQLATGENIIGPVLIDKTAKIGSGGLIGPNVVIGQNVRLEDGVRIMDSTVLSDTVIKTHSYVNESIIGWKCNIGSFYSSITLIKLSLFRKMGPNRELQRYWRRCCS